MSTKCLSTTPLHTLEEAVWARNVERECLKITWEISDSINEWLRSITDDERLQYFTEIYPNDRERPQLEVERYRERMVKHKEWEERRKNNLPPTKPPTKKRVKTTRVSDRVCVVYGLYKKDTLVYIGSTVNPTSRKKDHKRDKDFDIFRILYRGTEGDMRQLEREIITEEKPILNIVHNSSIV